LEEARKQKNVEERNQCRDPKISKKAQSLQRGGDVGDRLMEYGKQRAIRMSQQVEEQETKIQEEVMGQPQINPKSQNMDRNVDMYFAWEARKKLRLQQQQERQKAEEMKEVRSGPTISRNSARIVKQMNRATRIEDQLLTQGQMRTQKKKQEQDLKAEMDRENRKPKISVHSAALERPGNVCDRLYNLAQEKQNKDHAKARSKKVSEETASRQPRINSKSRLLVQQKKQKQRGGLKVEDRLLATGAKYRQKADTRAKAVKSHEVCPRKPKVGPYSQLLVELMEKRTGSTASSRLQQPTRQLKRSTLQDLEEEEMNMTFQPQLNLNSRQIDNHNNAGYTEGAGHSRRDLLFQRADEYEYRRARLQEQFMKKEMEECTFNPAIPEANRRQRPGQAKDDSDASFIERNMKWIRQRDRQREATRHDAQRKAMEECSFTPKLRGPEEGQRPAQPQRPSTAGATTRAGDSSVMWDDEEDEYYEEDLDDRWNDEGDDMGDMDDMDPVMMATRRAWEDEEAREGMWNDEEEFDEEYDDYEDEVAATAPNSMMDSRGYKSPQVARPHSRMMDESPFTDDDSVFAVSSPDESPVDRRHMRAENEANDWIKRAVGAASNLR